MDLLSLRSLGLKQMPGMPAVAGIRLRVVGRARFELAVSWSQTRRFSELSYRPRDTSTRDFGAPDSSSAQPPGSADRPQRPGAADAQDRANAADAQDRARAADAQDRACASDRQQ